MDIFKIIKTRRSIRRFADEPVSDEIINRIIEAGTWAPSGMNNQPWKFAVIKDSVLKEKISNLTKYSKTILSANALIAVFLDHSSGYDNTKDIQAIGACMQNMLLTVQLDWARCCMAQSPIFSASSISITGMSSFM